MAASKCPRCKRGVFEAVAYKPINLTIPVIFIQCAHCGTVVGVMHETDFDAELVKIKEALVKIAQSVGVSL